MKERVSIASFSLTGGRLAKKAAEVLMEMGAQVELRTMPKLAESLGQSPFSPDLKTWCCECWDRDELILFVGASGIAVRTIAPYVKSKVTDPAVLVMDEGGNYVISLLSGHLGGANRYAKVLAQRLGAVPVITTATDVHGKFAVDVWAKDNGLIIDDMKAAKEVSAAVLREDPVYLCCQGGCVEGSLPKELRIAEPENISALLEENPGSVVIWVGPEKPPMTADPGRILSLIPRCITLGIGCRKEQTAEAVRERTLEAAREYRLDLRSVERIASIDLKKEEAAIKALAKELEVPFITFTAEELRNVPGSFTPSGFVAGVTGVDNVCERSAVCGSGNGILIMPKQAGGGVTVAAAMGTWRIRF